MVFKKIIFQNRYVALETPSRPPPFMANAILNFHFDFLTPSLIIFLFFLFAFILLFSQSEVMWECSGSGVRCVMGAPSFPTSRSVRKGKEVYTAHSLLHYFYPKIKGIQILTSQMSIFHLKFKMY